VYNWWVFVHLLGVSGFLISHGVSVSVTFRLRRERDPKRVIELLELSGSSIRAFYASMVPLLVGGIVAGFLGKWWKQGWIWAGIIVLVVTSLAMYFMARPFYRRVGLVARAMAGGSQAVTEEQFDSILSSRRPLTIAGIGLIGLALILFFMIFKPTFGFGAVGGPPTPVASGSPIPPGAATVHVSATGSQFDSSMLSAPANQAFTIAFANEDRGLSHNVAVYKDSSASALLFRGAFVTGPKTVVYQVPALPPGTYFFRCDVHPDRMVGTIVVK